MDTNYSPQPICWRYVNAQITPMQSNRITSPYRWIGWHHKHRFSRLNSSVTSSGTTAQSANSAILENIKLTPGKHLNLFSNNDTCFSVFCFEVCTIWPLEIILDYSKSSRDEIIELVRSKPMCTKLSALFFGYQASRRSSLAFHCVKHSSHVDAVQSFLLATTSSRRLTICDFHTTKISGIFFSFILLYIFISDIGSSVLGFVGENKGETINQEVIIKLSHERTQPTKERENNNRKENIFLSISASYDYSKRLK